MKTFYFFSLLAFFSFNPLVAQKQGGNITLSRTWVSILGEPFKFEGVLYEVKDSAILVSNSLRVSDYSANKFDVTSLQIHNIQEIQIRRNNRMKNGMWIGAIAGFAVGGIWGLLLGDDPPCYKSWLCFRITAGQKALLLGIPLAFLGGSIGRKIGSVKITIPIFGSMDNYNKNKERLRSHSVIQL